MISKIIFLTLIIIFMIGQAHACCCCPNSSKNSEGSSCQKNCRFKEASGRSCRVVCDRGTFFLDATPKNLKTKLKALNY